jgi:pyruvate/2-oxoglutarate dehydrogenase complex dihydrolipoamide acyltransferase (E2) component
MDYQITVVLSYDSNEETREITQFNYVEKNIAVDVFNGVNKQKIIIKNVNDIT